MRNLKKNTLLNLILSFFSVFFLRKKGGKLPDAPKRILLIKTHAIGDTLIITPVMKALRRKFPDAYIVLLTGKSPGEIMEGNPDINEILSFDDSILFHPDLFKIIGLIKKVRARKFEIAFIFQYSSFIHIFAVALAIPFRVGFDNQGSGMFLTHKLEWDRKGQRLTADVHLDMARLVGAQTEDKKLRIEISDDDIRFADKFLNENKVSSNDLLIGIFPGGGKNSRDVVYQKRWNIDKYAAVIDSLFAKYKAEFIIFGSNSDKKVISQLVSLTKVDCINACEKVNLKQLAALIKRCSLLVTNDSVPLHIAVAMEIPVVCVFGPTPAKVILQEKENCIAIQSKYPCSPCYCNSVFPRCANNRCMESISSNEVLIAAESLLEKFFLRK